MALFLLTSRVMVKQDWTPSKVMHEHLQDLMSQRFMMAIELVTYHVP
jgi:hypothetical protein